MKRHLSTLAITLAVMFTLTDDAAWAQDCMSYLRQQKLQMMQLAQQCRVNAELLASIDRGSQRLSARDCSRPVGVSGQLDSFTECARVYLCATSTYNCAMQQAQNGTQCEPAMSSCLGQFPVPR